MEQKQTTNQQKKFDADYFEINTEKGKRTEIANNLPDELVQIHVSENIFKNISKSVKKM